MHRPALPLAVCAALALGCGPPPAEVDAGSGLEATLIPPVAPPDTARDRPTGHGTDDRRAEFGPQGAAEPARPGRDGAARDDVVSTATGEVIRRLADEDLFVLALASEVEDPGAGRATVVVTVLYGTGRSHPVEGSFRVGLRSTGGTWTVVSIEAAS